MYIAGIAMSIEISQRFAFLCFDFVTTALPTKSTTNQATVSIKPISTIPPSENLLIDSAPEAGVKMQKLVKQILLAISALFGFTNKGGVPSEIGSQGACPVCGQSALAETASLGRVKSTSRCPECGRLVRKQ
jgi:predicted RNA-binding Zn-ribbon protein involved in translation (DUF1610 family)